MAIATIKLAYLFDIHSGDYHATNELDSGDIPLISCGESNNGVIGYYDIPDEKTHKEVITVAYNGQPLTTKFHPYKFGAKDDVAVLIPRTPLSSKTQIYIAVVLSQLQWRYSYGRKCFRTKLNNVEIPLPCIERGGVISIDEDAIAVLFPKEYHHFIPTKSSSGIKELPKLNWHPFNIANVFHLDRGDFHSLADVDSGSFMTVSRVADNNGVVGYYDRPTGAKLYSKGHITVSTVGGDAFVQLSDFIATDNVIVCTPKILLRLTTLYFLVFMLNRQKWRYSYGRQCYQAKLERAIIYLPINETNSIDEDSIEMMVKQSSYWARIEEQFAEEVLPLKLDDKLQQSLPFLEITTKPLSSS